MNVAQSFVAVTLHVVSKEMVKYFMTLGNVRDVLCVLNEYSRTKHRTAAQCYQTRSCQRTPPVCLRSLRNSATQLRALPSTPNRRVSMSMRIEWSTVSKVADRSSSSKAPM